MFDSIVRKSIVYVSSFSQSVGEIQMLAHVGHGIVKILLQNLWFQSFWSLDVGKTIQIWWMFPLQSACAKNIFPPLQLNQVTLPWQMPPCWHMHTPTFVIDIISSGQVVTKSFQPKTCHPQSYLLIQGAEPTHLRAMEKLPDKSTVCKVSIMKHEPCRLAQLVTRHHQTILFSQTCLHRLNGKLNACFLVLVRSCVPKIIGQSPATSTPSTKDIPAFRQGHFAPVPIDFGQAGGNAGKISVRTGGLWSQQNEYPVLVIFTLETPWEKEPKSSLHTKAMWIFSQESGLQKKNTHPDS